MHCEICKNDRDFSVRSLAAHIRKAHHITKKEYYDEYLKKPNEGKCLICGKPTKFSTLRIGYLKFCSFPCSVKGMDYSYRKTDEYHKTISNALKNSATYYKIARSKERNEKLSKSLKKRYEDPEFRQAMLERTRAVVTPEYKERCRKNTTECIKSGKMKLKYCFGDEHFWSSYELYYALYLKINDISYIAQPEGFTYEFDGILRTYIPDFKVGDEYVEMKGKHFFDENGKMINPFDRTQDALYEAKHQCMIRNNVKIISDISEMKKIVDEHFGCNMQDECKRKRE